MLKVDFTSRTMGVGVSGYQFDFIPRLTEAASGTHAIMAGVRFQALALTAGVGATTAAASVYIEGAPTGATNNYAFWVDAGTSRFDGDIDLNSTGTLLNVGNAGNDWTATGITTLGSVAIGVAGSDQGTLTLAGLTSGVVTVAVAAAAGTWTMTLPTAVGAAGEQLTDAAGNGITSWAAAGSRREYKDILGVASPQDALDHILNTKVYHFHYKDGYGTRDYETEYVGIMADEAPWAMHYGGGIVNPVNTLGYMVLGFQAHEERIARLERQLVAAGIVPEA